MTGLEAEGSAHRAPARSNPNHDVDRMLERLEGLHHDELRRLWAEHFKRPPPKGRSRELLLRGVS